MYTIYEMCCDGFDQKLEQQFLKPNPIIFSNWSVG